MWGRQKIDYISRANCIPIWFFIVSILVVIVIAALTKKLSIGLFVGYVLVILGETVIFRTPTTHLHFQPQLFWSYKVWDIQKEQIIANVLAYVPFGLLAGRLWKWKGLLAGIGLSITSELLQLITYRGLMEFDDLLHNILGTLIGVSIYMICVELISKKGNNGFH